MLVQAEKLILGSGAAGYDLNNGTSPANGTRCRALAARGPRPVIAGAERALEVSPRAFKSSERMQR